MTEENQEQSKILKVKEHFQQVCWYCQEQQRALRIAQVALEKLR